MVMKHEGRAFIEVTDTASNNVLIRMNAITSLQERLDSRIIGLSSGESIHTRLSMECITEKIRQGYEWFDQQQTAKIDSITKVLIEATENLKEKIKGENEYRNHIMRNMVIKPDETISFRKSYDFLGEYNKKMSGINPISSPCSSKDLTLGNFIQILNAIFFAVVGVSKEIDKNISPQHLSKILKVLDSLTKRE